MKITLDRKDIEEAIKRYVRDEFQTMDNAELVVVQGKTATAIVTVSTKDKDENE